MAPERARDPSQALRVFTARTQPNLGIQLFENTLEIPIGETGCRTSSRGATVLGRPFMAVWDLFNTEIIAGLVLSGITAVAAALYRFYKKPRIIIQKATLSLAPSIALQGDVEILYKGNVYKKLIYCAFYLVNARRCPVPAGSFHVTLDKHVKLVDERTATYPENIARSIERDQNLPPHKLVFTYGELRPGDRVFFGLLTEAPSYGDPAFGLEYRGDLAVSIVEKVWPAKNPERVSWYWPLCVIFFACWMMYVNVDSLKWMAVGGMIVVSLLGMWRFHVWTRELSRRRDKIPGPTELLDSATTVPLGPAKPLTAPGVKGLPPVSDTLITASDASLSSPARLVYLKKLEQLAAEYSLLMVSTDSSAHSDMRDIQRDAYMVGRKLQIEDLFLFCAAIDNPSANANARRIMAMEAAAGKTDPSAFDLVLDVLDNPSALAEQRVALVVAVDLVGRLDRKLGRQQLLRLRSAVERQMADGAEYQITHEDPDRWLHSQQLLTAASAVMPTADGNVAPPDSRS